MGLETATNRCGPGSTALDLKRNKPAAVPAKPLNNSLSLTGSSCNSTDTAWSGPSRFFAPPWPNIPSPPTPACLRRPQLAAGSLVAAVVVVAGLLEGRTARSINAGPLPADCRRGNHPAPAPAARATLPSPSNCAAARLPRGAMGGNRDLGSNSAEMATSKPAVDR